MTTQQTTRDSFTFDELLKRWNCAEKKLMSAIISAELKPSIRLHDRLPLLTWSLDINGKVTASDLESGSCSEPERWFYLQDPVQTAPFDCMFEFVADDRDAVKHAAPLSSWTRLPLPMSLADVKREAVFLRSEVERYETAHLVNASGEDKSLGKRERDTLLKLILGMAIEGYKYNPEALKSETANEISTDLSKHQLNVSDETVRKYLKEAAKLFWPGKSL